MHTHPMSRFTEISRERFNTLAHDNNIDPNNPDERTEQHGYTELTWNTEWFDLVLWTRDGKPLKCFVEA